MDDPRWALRIPWEGERRLSANPEISLRFFADMLSESARWHLAPNRSCRLIVIPAEAGIHASHWQWIPAFAGMTTQFI
jgi:hypothetical protein